MVGKGSIEEAEGMMEQDTVGPTWQRNAVTVAKLDIIFTVLTGIVITIYIIIGAICYFWEWTFLTFGYTAVVAIPAIVACTMISLWGTVKLKPAVKNYESDPDDAFVDSAKWQNANATIFILIFALVLLLILLVKDYNFVHYIGFAVAMLIKGVFFHYIYQFRWGMEHRSEVADNLLKLAAVVLPQSKRV